MSRSLILRLLVTIAFFVPPAGGCGGGATDGRRTRTWFGGGADPSVTGAGRESPTGGLRIVDLVFEVRRAAIPAADTHHSRKIWNHVDELRLGADAAALLARNGLRIGAASPGSWPAIDAVLKAGGARIETRQLVTQRGWPLAIAMGPIAEGASIFTYDRSGRLSGKTYDGGEKLLNLDYDYHPQMGGSIDIGVRPEIRRDRGVLTWERSGDAIRQVPAYDRHRFEQLDAALTLHPTELLVIGPSDEANNEYLLGSRLLCDQRDGQRSETILFIVPHPYQTVGGARPPHAAGP